METIQWNSQTYDLHHSYVWKHGLGILELLEAKQGERILDLGCGTGHLAHEIAAKDAEVIGIDASREMIEAARTKYPRIRFELCEASELPFISEFDAVFSNAALHWMKDQKRVAAAVYRVLKPRGRFVAEFGGKDNLKLLLRGVREAFRACGLDANFSPWYFPSIAQYSALLEAQGLRVSYARLFDRLTEVDGGEHGMRNWLKTFVAPFLTQLSLHDEETFFAKAEEVLRRTLFHNTRWYADYVRLQVRAEKSG
jgi:ubiquinone/menaquinone biosynthesis C-methylase UbiE